MWVTLTLLGAGVLAGAGYLVQRTTLDAPSLREDDLDMDPALAA